MKTRFVFSAFCMLVAMTMATGAFAQAVFTVSSGNQPRGRLNSHTALAGGVTLAKLSGGDIGGTGGTVIIDYGVPITNAVNATGTATTDTIEVRICDADATINDADSAVVTKNTITVTVEATDCAGTGADAAIDVSGVRLSLAGSGQTGIVATVSSTGGIRLPSGSNQVSVINSIVDELVNDGVTVETLTLIRHTGSPEDGEYFKLFIEENAVDSFADAALDLDFSGLGTGMTVTLDAWVTTKDELDNLKPVEFVLIAEDENTDALEAKDNVLKNQQLAFDGDTLTADITALNNSARVLMGLGNVFRNEEGVLVEIEGIDESMIMGGSLAPAKVDVIVISWQDRSHDDGRQRRRTPSDPGHHGERDCGSDWSRNPAEDWRPRKRDSAFRLRPEPHRDGHRLLVGPDHAAGRLRPIRGTVQHRNRGGQHDVREECPDWRSPLRPLHEWPEDRPRDRGLLVLNIHVGAAVHDVDAAHRGAHWRRSYRQLRRVHDHHDGLQRSDAGVFISDFVGFTAGLLSAT